MDFTVNTNVSRNLGCLTGTVALLTLHSVMASILAKGVHWCSYFEVLKSPLGVLYVAIYQTLVDVD